MYCVPSVWTHLRNIFILTNTWYFIWHIYDKPNNLALPYTWHLLLPLVKVQTAQTKTHVLPSCRSSVVNVVCKILTDGDSYWLQEAASEMSPDLPTIIQLQTNQPCCSAAAVVWQYICFGLCGLLFENLRAIKGLMSNELVVARIPCVGISCFNKSTSVRPS